MNLIIFSLVITYVEVLFFVVFGLRIKKNNWAKFFRFVYDVNSYILVSLFLECLFVGSLIKAGIMLGSAYVSLAMSVYFDLKAGCSVGVVKQSLTYFFTRRKIK